MKECEKDINEMPGYPFNLHVKFTRCFVAGRRIVFGKWLARYLFHGPLQTDAKGDAANELIRRILEDDKPRLVSRFGANEMEAVLRGIDVQRKCSIFNKIGLMAIGKGGPFWYDNSIRARLCWNAGFFPVTDEALTGFTNRVCKDIAQIDILASWLPGEKQLRNYYAPAMKAIPFLDLEPFWHKNPWTSALRNKRVLVVHPFSDTIRAQYKKRQFLFKDPEMLPDFTLLTYRTLSSFAGNKVPFATWFDALDKMCADIAKIDFDIALIGCGAYGMSIGAFIKRDLGRKAIHLGGVTQMIFGIKGKRWDSDSKYCNRFYNNYWTRPFASDKVENVNQIEGGNYCPMCGIRESRRCPCGR